MENKTTNNATNRLTYDTLYRAIDCADLKNNDIAKLLLSKRALLRKHKIGNDNKTNGAHLLGVALVTGMYLETNKTVIAAVKKLRGQVIENLEKQDRKFEREYDDKYWNQYD